MSLPNGSDKTKKTSIKLPSKTKLKRTPEYGWILPCPLIKLTTEQWKEYWRPKKEWYY